MAAFVVVLLGLLGFAIGFAVSGEPAGGVAADRGRGGPRKPGRGRHVLRGRLARADGQRRARGRRGRRPAADERRARDGHRRQRADAARLPHRGHGAQRLRDRPRPRSMPRSRSRPACSRSSTARSCRASSGTSSRTSATSTSGSRSSSGVMVGAIAILADFFLRFTFWGGGSRGRDRDSGGGGGAQTIVFIIAIALAILAPMISRFIQLAVNRQREYLADASAVELTRNPYGLERALAKISADHGGARGRQPRHPAHVLHEPDQEVRGARVGPDVDPPADHRSDQSAASAHRRGRHWARPSRRNSPAWSRGAGWPMAEPSKGRGILRLRRRAANAVGHRAEVAQSVEHATENRGVASSILALGTTFRGGRHSERKWLSW